MTEINRPKLNLSALKWNKQSTTKTPENQEEKTSINQNTSNLNMIKKTKNINTEIKKPNISVNTNIINKQEDKIEEVKVETKQDNQINTEKTLENSTKIEKLENLNIDNNITKASLQETILKKEEELLKSENTEKNAEIKEKTQQQINENWEIFSGYTSDFANKKEEALKESKKIKFPDSPKKIFFAIFTSLLILSSLALVIIFKVDKPVTNKLKTNILELIGKAEKKPVKIEKKITETWSSKTYNSLWFSIKYEISNTNKYKIEWKILNNKNEFDDYIKNRIEKLKLEKLKEHLQEEKVAN